jgi:hypothetical protein
LFQAAFLIEEKITDYDKISNDSNMHGSTVDANGFNQKQFNEDQVGHNCNAQESPHKQYLQ